MEDRPETSFGIARNGALDMDEKQQPQGEEREDKLGKLLEDATQRQEQGSPAGLLKQGGASESEDEEEEVQT